MSKQQISPTPVRYNWDPNLKCHWPQYEEKWKTWYVTQTVEETNNLRL